jgi:hypothetical protein
MRIEALAHMTWLSDAAKAGGHGPSAGLIAYGSELMNREPFATFEKIGGRVTTVETINYLRRQQGLGRYEPADYVPPAGIAMQNL